MGDSYSIKWMCTLHRHGSFGGDFGNWCGDEFSEGTDLENGIEHVNRIALKKDIVQAVLFEISTNEIVVHCKWKD